MAKGRSGVAFGVARQFGGKPVVQQAAFVQRRTTFMLQRRIAAYEYRSVVPAVHETREAAIAAWTAALQAELAAIETRRDEILTRLAITDFPDDKDE